ncbi:MAG: phosphatidate cytidylyltransferase [Planctomycetes bacterium]|nr:phosphatidate cytidylyltransferase [Planctomycetota bacterium]
MLRTRLWMGAVLVVLVVAVLVVDQHLAPWYPFLFLLVQAIGGLAVLELRRLLPATWRPSAWLSQAAVALLIAANWPAHVFAARSLDRDAWHWVLGVFAAVVLAAFLVEMARFREPGQSVVRMAFTVWLAGYLGLLPSFFVQPRWTTWTEAAGGVDRGTVALALMAFVPKCGDIGAYFTGRFLGRHRLAPVLSPKKTWEGAAGALAASILAAAGINRLGPVLPSWWQAVGFGITVGVAGLLGDLAESLIKRDCGHKDASQAVPGFGGILDVVDAVIFAAPVAYLWLI